MQAICVKKGKHGKIRSLIFSSFSLITMTTVVKRLKLLYLSETYRREAPSSHLHDALCQRNSEVLVVFIRVSMMYAESNPNPAQLVLSA